MNKNFLITFVVKMAAKTMSVLKMQRSIVSVYISTYKRVFVYVKFLIAQEENFLF